MVLNKSQKSHIITHCLIWQFGNEARKWVHNETEGHFDA